jgi:hypothetical protein
MLVCIRHDRVERTVQGILVMIDAHVEQQPHVETLP